MIAVKDFISSFKMPVDWTAKAKKAAKDRGIKLDDVIKEWEEAKQKGITKGNSLHLRKQNEFIDSENYVKYNYIKTDGDFVYDPKNYKVENGFIYDEKPFVLNKYNLIGIPDRVIIKGNKINIDEFKSDKAIYMSAKSIKAGMKVIKKKMLYPINHMDDCNYVHHALQASLYMRLVWENNKTLRPGEIRILHTIHDEDTLEPKKEVIIKVPYLRNEVELLLNTLKK